MTGSLTHWATMQVFGKHWIQNASIQCMTQEGVINEEEERIQTDPEGLDRNTGILATVYRDTCPYTPDLVWSIDTELICV